jgi:hypothetical protein
MNLIVLKKLLNLITLGKRLADKISRMITMRKFIKVIRLSSFSSTITFICVLLSLSLSFSLMITLNGIYFSSFFRTQQQKIEERKPPAKGTAKSAAVDPASKEVLKGKKAPKAVMDAPNGEEASKGKKALPNGKEAPKVVKDAPPKTEARPKT